MCTCVRLVDVAKSLVNMCNADRKRTGANVAEDNAIKVADCFHGVAPYVDLQGLCRCMLVSRFWKQSWCSQNVWMEVFSIESNFEGISIDMNAMNFMLKVLPSKLQKLALQCDIEVDAMLKLGGCFKDLRFLRCFQAAFPWRFNDSHVEQFTSDLTRLSLSTLHANFKGTDISDAGVSSLAACILSFQHLTQLILEFDATSFDEDIEVGTSTGTIGDVGLKAIGATVSYLPVLEHFMLCFDNTAVTDEGMHEFAPELARMSSLTSFKISFVYTAVGDVGVQELAASFNQMPNLTSISILSSHSRLSDAGAIDLSHILGQKRNLRSVEMDFFPLFFTDAGIVAFGANLAASLSIESIVLMFNCDDGGDGDGGDEDGERPREALKSLAENIARLPELKAVDLACPVDEGLGEELQEIFADVPGASVIPLM